MGIFIDGIDLGTTFVEKTRWCQEHGEPVAIGGIPLPAETLLQEESLLTQEIKGEKNILVIVVDNGPFAAAGVMFNSNEVQAAIGGGNRVFLAFHIPKSTILEYVTDETYANIVKNL